MPINAGKNRKVPPKEADPRAWNPTDTQRAQVKLWSSGGASVRAIARVMNVDTKTLMKHCRDELDFGMAKGETISAEKLMSMMLGDNITALIWYQKTVLGRTERVELTGKNGQPIQYQDVGRLTDEQLAAIAIGGSAGDHPGDGSGGIVETPEGSTSLN